MCRLLMDSAEGKALRLRCFGRERDFFTIRFVRFVGAFCFFGAGGHCVVRLRTGPRSGIYSAVPLDSALLHLAHGLRPMSNSETTFAYVRAQREDGSGV